MRTRQSPRTQGRGIRGLDPSQEIGKKRFGRRASFLTMPPPPVYRRASCAGHRWTVDPLLDSKCVTGGSGGSRGCSALLFPGTLNPKP